MPTYQYVCTNCARELEAVQSFTDAPLRDCPSCAGVLRKVFSSVGVVFKGSGFYRNDSRDAAATTAKAANGKKQSGDGATDTAKDGGAKSSGAKESTSGDKAAGSKPAKAEPGAGANGAAKSSAAKNTASAGAN